MLLLLLPHSEKIVGLCASPGHCSVKSAVLPVCVGFLWVTLVTSHSPKTGIKVSYIQNCPWV